MLAMDLSSSAIWYTVSARDKSSPHRRLCYGICCYYSMEHGNLNQSKSDMSLVKLVMKEALVAIQLEELPEGGFLATSDELPGLVAHSDVFANVNGLNV